MAIWDRAADVWDRWRDLLQGQYEKATERLLDMASVGPDSRVMDVAVGPGYQTIQIASRLGRNGYVLASDISPVMVRVAEKNVRDAGFENAEFKVMDATALSVEPESFDAVICRQGVMTFPAPQRALDAMYFALKSGGKIGISVFAPAERNPYLFVPAEIISRHMGLPPDTPKMLDIFQFGEVDALEGLLSNAGFQTIKVERFATPMILKAVDEYVTHLSESSRVLLELMEDANEETESAIWREIADAARQFMDGDVFKGPGEILIAAAEKQ
jgi:ubiquinone/menaquinone biosynthesis C-methylase UbiE